MMRPPLLPTARRTATWCWPTNRLAGGARMGGSGSRPRAPTSTSRWSTRPTVEPASTALITLATGLGVRDAVASLLPGRSVLVKWPNDIWIERRKCAGVLVESRTLGMRIDSVIIGVGLNVNRMQWPPELAGAATSLRAERAARSHSTGPRC